MKKFILLNFVIPVQNNNKKLVGLQLKKFYVNIDNISHFEEVNIPYPQKTDKDDYYPFYENLRDNECQKDPDIWETDTTLKIQFEDLHSHFDKCISEFKDLGFIKGIRIHFKSGVNPIYKENKPVYAMDSATSFNF
ncbi:TPA: hypothetical protein RNY16_002183 [Pasteurella multocida]|nr:hypothetical protein [Pasteurella multocida]